MAWLLDLLLPPHCVACRRAGPVLCDGCRRMLVRLRAPLCERCGAPTEWPVARCRECSRRRLAFGSARAAVVYTGVAPALVRAWKERGLRLLATVAAELVVEVVPRPAADVITYIPPDGDRSVRRGHHPAQRRFAVLSPLKLKLNGGAVDSSADLDLSIPGWKYKIAAALQSGRFDHAPRGGGLGCRTDGLFGRGIE